MSLLCHNLKNVRFAAPLGDTWGSLGKSPDLAVVCIVFILYNPRDTQIPESVRLETGRSIVLSFLR